MSFWNCSSKRLPFRIKWSPGQYTARGSSHPCTRLWGLNLAIDMLPMGTMFRCLGVTFYPRHACLLSFSTGHFEANRDFYCRTHNPVNLRWLLKPVVQSWKTVVCYIAKVVPNYFVTYFIILYNMTVYTILKPDIPFYQRALCVDHSSARRNPCCNYCVRSFWREKMLFSVCSV